MLTNRQKLDRCQTQHKYQDLNTNLFKSQGVNWSINSSLPYKEVMIKDGHMVFSELDIKL